MYIPLLHNLNTVLTFLEIGLSLNFIWMFIYTTFYHFWSDIYNMFYFCEVIKDCIHSHYIIFNSTFIHI